MEQLLRSQTLIVRQQKEWGEILTGFEAENKYEVMTPEGQRLFWAGEQSPFLARYFFRGGRPFLLRIIADDGKEVLRVQRPFRFLLDRATITDPAGTILGEVRERFHLLARRFSVRSPSGQDLYVIHGPLLHPWTFNILEHDREVGKIAKQWSGMGKEIFTDADNFTISFPAAAPMEMRAVLLGALFLIDMRFFEKKK